MKILHTPSLNDIESSAMNRFRKRIAEKYSIPLLDYFDLHRWSVNNPESFWAEWAEESGMVFRTKGYNIHRPEKNSVLEQGEHFRFAKWFPGSELNFAENLLRKFFTKEEEIAIHFQPESDTVSPRYLHREFFLREVLRLIRYWKELGVKKGDRIAAVLPNSPESLIGMLATTSLGGIWSSASPDFGTKGILDRFGQIEPKILIVSDGYFFKGKRISCLEKWREVLSELPSVESCLVWNFTRPNESIDMGFGSGSARRGRPKIQLWDELDPFQYPGDFPKDPEKRTEADYKKLFDFTPIQFSDPVYIMYSSGTTGLPKCIVQGPGVLLNHTKELILHTDIRESESISYYTTCGWMMWNWIASSLFIGSRLCIFDGNPFYPDWKFLWQWIEREKINVFGTSAKYLSVLQQENASPKIEYPLTNLRCILSTGSPLPPAGFEYVYNHIKPTLQLASISGGTDLNGCFALGNPTLPVRSGEIQCIGLGMDVEIWNEDGQSIQSEKGELVCRKPFPSMPLGFWKDESGEKYKSAYFDRFENIWCHGDFAELTENQGMIIYGRSDATLNPGGVRIGTADIYNVLEKIPEIEDSVIIGQNWKDDVRIVLFVKISNSLASNRERRYTSKAKEKTMDSDPYPMNSPTTEEKETNPLPLHPTGKDLQEIDPDLYKRITREIRTSCSPRHVPSLILTIEEVPYTVNGKKVELAIKNICEGREVKNAGSLANPNCLDEYRFLRKEYLSL